MRVGALFVALSWAVVTLRGAAAQEKPGSGASTAPLSATPSELRAGEAVTVAGFGCAPSNEVRFDLFQPERSSSAVAFARPDGSFAHDITIPATTRTGRVWLQASCLTGDSQSRVMEAVLLVNKPAFTITGVNLAFGAGTMMVFLGVGLLVLRDARDRVGRG